MNLLLDSKSDVALKCCLIDFLSSYGSDLKFLKTESSDDLVKDEFDIDAESKQARLLFNILVCKLYTEASMEADPRLIDAAYVFYFSNANEKDSGIDEILNNDSIIEDDLRNNKIDGYTDVQLYAKFRKMTCQFLRENQDVNITICLINMVENDSPNIRLKTMKGLQQICSADPNILSNELIRNAFISKTLDPGASIREVSIDVLGELCLKDSTILKEYYESLRNRSVDTSAAIRKKIIKWLRNLYDKNYDNVINAHVIVTLIERLHDEQDTVTDLAMKMLHEILFQKMVVNDVITYSDLSPSLQSKLKKNCDAFSQSLVLPVDVHLLDKLLQSVKKEENKRTLRLLCDCFLSEESSFQESDNPPAEKHSRFLNAMKHMSKYHPEFFVEHLGAFADRLLAFDPRVPVTDPHVIDKMNSTIAIIKNIVSKCNVKHSDVWRKIEKHLFFISLMSSKNLLRESIETICIVVETTTKNNKVIYDLLEKVYTTVSEKYNAEMINYPDRYPSLLYRCVKTIGFLFEFFSLFHKNALDRAYSLLCKVSESALLNLRIASVEALGSVFARYPTMITLPETEKVFDKLFQEKETFMALALIDHFHSFIVQNEDKLTLKRDEDDKSFKRTEFLGVNENNESR
jgi:hypothetical protein